MQCVCCSLKQMQRIQNKETGRKQGSLEMNVQTEDAGKHIGRFYRKGKKRNKSGLMQH